LFIKHVTKRTHNTAKHYMCYVTTVITYIWVKKIMHKGNL